MAQQGKCVQEKKSRAGVRTKKKLRHSVTGSALPLSPGLRRRLEGLISPSLLQRLEGVIAED